jgi:hypothetical protein
MFEKYLDRLFGFDKIATKDDCKKLEKAVDALLTTIKSNNRASAVHSDFPMGYYCPICGTAVSNPMESRCVKKQDEGGRE